MSPPFPAATVSRSRVGASRAPAAPLRGRFATLDPPTRSQDPAAIREQADERQRILTKDRTGARSRYAKSPRFQGNPAAFEVMPTFPNPYHFSVVLPDATARTYAELRGCFNPPVLNPGYEQR
jgi:hypothetical protein